MRVTDKNAEMIDNCGCFYEYEGPDAHRPDCPVLLEHTRALTKVTRLKANHSEYSTKQQKTYVADMTRQRDEISRLTAEGALWQKYAEHLVGCTCADTMDCGRIFYRHDWPCDCGLRELQEPASSRQTGQCSPELSKVLSEALDDGRQWRSESNDQPGSCYYCGKHRSLHKNSDQSKCAL